ncbi:hypothetical protein [Rhodococcus wratislaviensis]|uniref:hypothetical protein n=1 Tax=Rhodococcus wratislaviensis TaxID=44752 RepID=UPI000F564DDE|nr:hypothetical protein [Rhodococcus wratislaviensis]
MLRPAPRPRILRQLATAVFGCTALLAMSAAPAAASPFSGLDSFSAAPVPPGPEVNLNAYCDDHDAVGHLANGRTVYCRRVARTDAYVWAYTPDLMPIDPNGRKYTCGSDDVCRYPDGSIAPNYLRCGTLCGEPPTSGDIQSGFYDCFSSGLSYEECRPSR